jgi:fatty acid desaturase
VVHVPNSRFCSWVGALTCWIAVNPVSIFLMSAGTMTRWTIVGHHVCHGGFDKCSDGKFNRFKFGVGSVYQRCKDWLDWMLVEAWNMEHNQLHHYHLGEESDPDLVSGPTSAGTPCVRASQRLRQQQTAGGAVFETPARSRPRACPFSPAIQGRARSIGPCPRIHPPCT